MWWVPLYASSVSQENIRTAGTLRPRATRALPVNFRKAAEAKAAAAVHLVILLLPEEV
jgi:hypothetical protein